MRGHGDGAVRAKAVDPSGQHGDDEPLTPSKVYTEKKLLQNVEDASGGGGTDGGGGGGGGGGSDTEGGRAAAVARELFCDKEEAADEVTSVAKASELGESSLDLRLDLEIFCHIPLKELDASEALVLAELLRTVSFSGLLTEIKGLRFINGEEGWCAVFDALRENTENKIARWYLYNQVESTLLD